MSDFDDGYDNLDEGDVRDELSRKMRTEGAMVAYDTAITICRDPKATAAAKASAVNSLFRAGGFFANHDSGDGGKDLSEMSADDVKALLRKAETALAQRMAAIGKPAGGLFD
jgi:hypothetical protein